MQKKWQSEGWDGMEWAARYFVRFPPSGYVIWVGDFESAMHFWVKRGRALFPAQAMRIKERGAGHLLNSHH